MTCRLCGEREAETSVPDGFGDPVLVCGHCEALVLDGRPR